VFQVAVFALRDGAHAETDSDALVEYRLNFDPHAPLGLTLGETLRPYLDQRRDRTIGQREEKTGESLLQEIAAILGKRSDVSWDLFPSSEEKWVTAKELGHRSQSEMGTSDKADRFESSRNFSCSCSAELRRIRYRSTLHLNKILEHVQQRRTILSSSYDREPGEGHY
jgi:hypothetical protein